MRNLTCGDLEILLVVIGLVLTRTETEETICEKLGSCVSWTYSRGRGRSLKLYTLILGLKLGGSKVEKWGDHQKKKCFKNNSVEALNQFKEEPQDPLKLHVPWERRRNFHWSSKITCEEAFQNILKSILSFVGAYEDSNVEKIGRQQKE